MLNRQGWFSLVAGLIAVVVGRVFGVMELFIISAAFCIVPLFGLAYVWLRRPNVTAHRWIHPKVLVAGDVGLVDLRLEQGGAIRSAPFELAERVRRVGAGDNVARLSVSSLRPGTLTTAGYQLPTNRRGIITLGPLDVEVTDPLGVARSVTRTADIDHVTVAPKAYLLDMPVLGQGMLGRHLVAQARRLGPGDFHGLRTYVDGDEPRSIDWKASARSEDLLVREYVVEGVRRCTVIFDADPDSYLDADGFERGITAAASLVHSAEHAALTTRFVTAGGVDLRGPDTSTNTLRVLASIEPDRSGLGQLDRDPGEGLGLLIVVTGSAHGAAWKPVQSIVDPTLTRIGVTTDERNRERLGVSARSDLEFIDSWRALNGARSSTSPGATPAGVGP